MRTIERRLRFVCPQCGGFTWGGNEHQATCHDSTERGCRFSWNRRDDWRYFVDVWVRAFDHVEEYEAGEDAQRSFLAKVNLEGLVRLQPGRADEPKGAA